MSRLDKGRQERLEPVRMDYAERKLRELGYEITGKNDIAIEFTFKGSTVKLFPYSGWHTGKTIKDGRGLNNLLRQINDK